MARREMVAAGRRAHIAVFEATSLIAKGLKDHLVARAFPAASVRLFTSSDNPDANLTEYGGEPKLVTRPDLDDLGELDIAFLCGTAGEVARYLDWPGRAGFTAIDLSSAALATGAPVVNVGVNPEAIAAGPGVIAAPGPIPHLLSSLLAPILRGPGLVEAVVVVFPPASELGEPGIEELYQQTLGILNFQDPPKDVFGDQLAFNLIPASLHGPGGRPENVRTEEGLEREVRAVTGGAYGLAVQVVLAPVFHGHAVLARVTLPAGAGSEALSRSLRGSGTGVALAGAADRPTPVGRAGQEGILVSGLRPAGDNAFWIWAVSDNLAGGAALNAVRIAETLLERGLGRST